ncbi:MAG: lipase family protein, partial [Gordonia sp. (in: high G+C Gram-positive bacteria)]
MTAPQGISPRRRIELGVLAILAIALGALLLLRPFPSIPWMAAILAIALIVVGVLDLMDAELRRNPVRLAVAVALPIVGVVLLAWRGLSIFGIAVAATIALGVWGIGRWLRAARGAHAWWVDVLMGVAAIAAAVLALSWPGVSVFLTVQAVGVALIWRGGAELIRVVRNRRKMVEAADSVSRWRTFLGTVAALVAVAITVPLAIATFVVRGTAPVPGPFYQADLPTNTAPGTLLRVEPSTQGTPTGARAWRILYSTMRGNSPALASGTVLIPDTAPAKSGPRPVIAWAHGTTGVAENCAPSMMAEPFGHIPGLKQVIANGWALVAADYIGLGTKGPSPYVIGEGEARSVLDSVRAARSLPDLTLSNQTVVWGHSQGGHAALWTELLAPSYAPEVTIIGTAAQAPAATLQDLAVGMETM